MPLRCTWKRSEPTRMRRSIMRLAARMSGEQPRQGMLDTNILILRRWIDPAELTAATRDAIWAGLARRRVDTDRDRHRDRKTKARLGFPAGGPHLATTTATAQISVCGPIAA